MKDKLLLFAKMLYSNKALLKTAKAGVLVTAMMLFINVSLVSAPNYVGYMRGVGSIDELHAIEEAFEAMYDDELDCSVEGDGTMQCDAEGENTYGDYAFRFQETVDAEDIDENTIVFTPEKAVIVHHEDGRTVVDGDYSLLEDFDFSEIKTLAEDRDDPEAYYANNTDFFLKNLYYSDLNDTVGMIYTVQFAQTFLYVFFVSLMFMMLNFRASIKKITYKASLRITIFAMTGPALLSAVLGLRISTWAYVLFTILYLSRVIVLYYRLHRSKITIGIDDPDLESEVE
ncbi:MAG: DUF1189 family protein [Candidatus Izemoplasmataceae bacterium]